MTLRVVQEPWSVPENTRRRIKPPYYDWKFQRSWYRVSSFVKACFLKRCFVENFLANRDPLSTSIKQKISAQGFNPRNNSFRVRPQIKYRKKQLE